MIFVDKDLFDVFTDEFFDLGKVTIFNVFFYSTSSCDVDGGDRQRGREVPKQLPLKTYEHLPILICELGDVFLHRLWPLDINLHIL
jgi:hypothetical protein